MSDARVLDEQVKLSPQSQLKNALSFAHPGRNVELLKLNAGMNVADFGSGSGAYVFEMAKAVGPGGHVYAVDIQKDLLRRTKNEAEQRGVHNVEVLWGDVEDPGGSKISDHSLDLVLLSNVLFQVQNKDRVLGEAKRVLKDTGRLAIIDWTDVPFSGSRIGPHEGAIVSKKDLLADASRLGFSLECEFDPGAHHFGVMLKQ